MSFHQSATVLNSQQAAVSELPADPTQLDSFFDNLLAEVRREDREKARIREESKSREYEAAAMERMGIRRGSLKQIKYWDRRFENNPYEASLEYTQLMYFGSRRGWNKPVEKPEDETPVMNRTRTGQKMLNWKPTTRADFGLSSAEVKKRQYDVEVQFAYEHCLQRLKDGWNINELREGLKAGRPSKSFKEGRTKALEEFFGRENYQEPEDQEAAE